MTTLDAELHDLLAWGSELEGFTETHARDGLVLAHSYIEGIPDGDGGWIAGIGAVHERCALLLATDLAWLLWLDDCFDLGEAPVDLDLLLAAIDGPAWSREGRGYQHLRTQMQQATTCPRALAVWTQTASDVFRAYHRNAEWARAPRPLSYGEYLDNGEHSIATTHFVATTALIYGWDLAARLRKDTFRRCLRHLSLLTRLQNDLASAERERHDRTPANAVLLLEPMIGPTGARELVRRELDGYRRSLHRDLTEIDRGDPFCGFVNVLVRATDQYYSDPRARYQVTDPI
ncbi:MAG TPA: terpene synthase family protein [Kofleriaceae bacterium]